MRCLWCSWLNTQHTCPLYGSSCSTLQHHRLLISGGWHMELMGWEKATQTNDGINSWQWHVFREFLCQSNPWLAELTCEHSPHFSLQNRTSLTSSDRNSPTPPPREARRMECWIHVCPKLIGAFSITVTFPLWRKFLQKSSALRCV